MLRSEIKQLHNEQRRKRILMRIRIGFHNLLRSKWRDALVLGYTIWFIVTWILGVMAPAVWIPVERVGLGLRAMAIDIMILLLGCYVASHPIRANKIESALYRIGMVDHIGDTPVYVRTVYEQEGAIRRIYLLSESISYATFIDFQLEIESALNLAIQSIQPGKNKQEIIIIAASGDFQFPPTVLWHDKLLPRKTYE